jgi:mono/diheme cytochrome c family protein
MKPLTSLKPGLLASVELALIGAILLAVSLTGFAADEKATKDAKSEKKAEAKPEKKKLSGQELYAIHCNRCHPERYATERSAAQWKTLMLHMRVRANLPAEQAKAIVKYLQEDAGRP